MNLPIWFQKALPTSLLTARAEQKTSTFVWLAAFAFALLLFSSSRISAQQGNDPIAYLGHGAMFDGAGNEIEPTIQFIANAQAWYRATLVARLKKPQRDSLAVLERSITANLTLDPQSRLVVNARLLDWLADQANIGKGDSFRGKLKVLNRALANKLPGQPGEVRPANPEPFQVTPELQRRLEKIVQPGVQLAPRLLLVSNTSGAAYRTFCGNHGVPVPPDFGPGSAWVSRGVINESDLFIVRSRKAEVLTYASTTPAGMCVALPRFDNASNSVTADGVICLGQADPLGGPAKTCFWDNQDPASASGIFTFTRGTSQAFSQWAGGSDLQGGVGGVCSDCHAGENPYVIHGTILNSLSGVPLQTFAPTRYDPIVRTGDTVMGNPLPWPENPGPMNSPTPCQGCHGTASAPGFAGRLPHISTSLPSYCGSVLRSALGAKSPALPGSLNAVAAMPPSGTLTCTPNIPVGDPRHVACTVAMSADCTPPGSSFVAGDIRIGNPTYNVSCTPEVSALVNWCGQAPMGDASGRGDPHITSVGGQTYDFQSAGEFVYLTSGTGTEIQVRQTPVSTASPVLNAYTGLSSCVSVNTAMAARLGGHRVTFQPASKGDEKSRDLRLQVDGKPVVLANNQLSLGGGKITRDATGALEMDFPDQTHLIVTPGFWGAPNNIWYLNIDVDKTPAREGILGSITAGSWLPLLNGGTPFGPKPASLIQRFTDVNQKLADSWRVTGVNSLFDYSPGETTDTFTNKSWPPNTPRCLVPGSAAPANPMNPARAKELCGRILDKTMRAQCTADVTATGDPGFAKTYLLNQQLKTRRIAQAAKIGPAVKL